MPDTQLYAPTIFIDLDGTIIKHQGPPWSAPMELLPGVQEYFATWRFKEAKVIITTGRPEHLRAFTQQGLMDLKLHYDQLIMGLTSGTRILINDLKPYDPVKATAIARNLRRDEGLKYLVL